jgi:hypothetical protein
MPPGSLSSLKPEDHADSQFLPEDSKTSGTSASLTRDASQGSPEYRSAQTSSTSLSSTSCLPATEADRQHHIHQSAPGDCASGPARPLSTQPPPHTLPTSFAPQAPPYWQNMPGMGTVHAVPYIFEPIPILGEEGLNLNQVDEFNGAETLDPDSLTAMWCLLEEETQAQGGGEGSATAAAGRSGTFWLVEGVQAGEYWPQFNGACMPLEGGMMHVANSPQGSLVPSRTPSSCLRR